MLQSPIFRAYLVVAFAVWAVLFYQFSSIPFLIEHWYYPAVMVGGAFVAGVTPEGGGAVAFPILNVFLNIPRPDARDFSLMIQSVGMTSAAIYILTRADTVLADFKPLLWWLPVAFLGFVIGMHTLQGLPVYIMQGFFLSLIMTFVIAYYFSTHRGVYDRVDFTGADYVWLVAILIGGGLCASLFGTGADIFLYVLLTTRFALKEKKAAYMSIILMGFLSLLGYGYRGLYEQALTADQVSIWLCAAPVVLIMAPLGSYVLGRISVDFMLKFVIVLNVFQLVYFNLFNPSMNKLIVSVLFTVLLGGIFYYAMLRVAARMAKLNLGQTGLKTT
jgi:uncharacterized protein